MSSWKRSLISLGALVISTSAFAGEKLRFVQGELDTKDASSFEQMVPMNVPRNESVSSQNYVVQFKSAITEADKQWLKKLKVEVLQYIPDDAYLVSNVKVAIQTLQSNPRVNGVVPFLSTWKISPQFDERSVFNAEQREAVLIQVLRESDLQNVVQILSSIPQVEVKESSGRYIVALSPKKDLERISTLENVLWIQPVPQVDTMEFDVFGKGKGGKKKTPPKKGPKAPKEDKGGDYTDLNGGETGTGIMKFDKAWERGFTGKGQIVAMADTGLDSGELSSMHQDFKNVPKGYALGMLSMDWSDPMGHGTHVAGSVMGSGKASKSLLKGGAHGAELIAEGMWSSLFENLTVPPELKKLFEPVYKDGARIHTNSWGNGDPKAYGVYDGMSQQVDEYMWNNPEMLVIFAAGNSGVDNDKDGRVDEGQVSSPGTAKNALTVGASENVVAKMGIQKKLGELKDGKLFPAAPLKDDTLSNDANGIAAFSSRGPTKDGRIKPDVVAPGTNILSVCSQVEGASKLWGAYNTDYCFSGGTSMSTPLTAGAAAVAREFLVKKQKIERPSAALVKGILMNSADDVFPGQYGNEGKTAGQEILTAAPNVVEGYGRVNVDNATNEEFFLKVVDNTEGVKGDDKYEVEIDTKDVKTLKVTLVYTDAPGTPNAARTLVNNLDLEVEAGKTVSSNSEKDNSEQIVIKELAQDKVKVRVIGKSIPRGKDGKQPFALIVSH